MSLNNFLQTREIRHLIDTLQKSDVPARFVGGCVRDALAGLIANDVDMATPLPPDQISHRLRAVGIKTYQIGRQHCTVIAPIGGKNYEITTLREDIATDGRHATVRLSDDWQCDAARRDFTINALYADFAGNIYDYHDGIADFKAGRVQFIGDPNARIAEDYLRILRFVRFSARFAKGPPDERGLQACIDAKENLAKLSHERIRQEFMSLLALPYRHDIWQILIDNGLMEYIITGLDKSAILRLQACAGESADPLIRLTALLWGNPSAKDLLRNLRFSNADSDCILKLLASHRDDFSPPLRALDKYKHIKIADMALSVQLCNGSITSQQAATITQDWHASNDKLPEFPLSGDDYKCAGIPPGPKMGKVERAMRGWWLDHNTRPDRAACLAELAQYTRRD